VSSKRPTRTFRTASAVVIQTMVAALCAYRGLDSSCLPLLEAKTARAVNRTCGTATGSLPDIVWPMMQGMGQPELAPSSEGDAGWTGLQVAQPLGSLGISIMMPRLVSGSR
jgi:hypothetical protein